MPELPEVETIRQGLKKHVLFKTLKKPIVNLPKMVRGNVDQFQDVLSDNQFVDIDRFAKLLVFRLADSEFSMLLHLKMTGQLIYPIPTELVAGGHPFPKFNLDLPNKYTHLIFPFADGTNLYFNDLRQFGYLQLATSAELDKIAANYGLEPGTTNFTWKKFQTLMKRRRTPLKNFLLNQQVIAGLGNIYADEVAFYAGIKPTRTVDTLTLAEQKLLFQGIQEIIAKAIQHRGTTFRNYADNEGRQGGYAPFLQVYGRAGEKCLRCGDTIAKIKLAGRGTHYCPNCQK